jgi:hypothetical protein
MPATKPRSGLPTNSKFNPHNGSRAELDAEAAMARLKTGITKRVAFQGIGGLRLFAIYCDHHPD